MKAIPLTNGGSASVDDGDFPVLSSAKWWRNASGYAVRHTRYFSVDGIPQPRGTIFMHRVIIGTPPEGLQVDHINRNRLDNRRQNLRFVTHAQSMFNRQLPRKNNLGVRGVEFYPDKKNPFRVRLGKGKRRISCGYFSSMEEARSAAIEAGKRIYGTSFNPEDW